MTTYQRKKDLYRRYCEELGVASGVVVDADVNCDAYINDKGCKWINIPGTYEDIFAGFLIIGKDMPNKHKDSDYAICEAYLDPQYRGKGLLSQAFKEYVPDHEGVWSLLILKGNEEVTAVWDHLFNSLGYVRCDLDSSSLDESLILIGYRRE